MKNRRALLVKKNHYSERINLAEENNSLLTNCEEVAKEMNNFFVNAVKILNMAYYKNRGSFAENINAAILKAKGIVKWRNHPSILAIASEYENRANFFLNFVSKEDILTEIKALDNLKAIQENDIPVKIIKENYHFFAETICCYFNISSENGKFPNCLKLANITPVSEKGARISKVIIHQLVFSQFFKDI